MINHIHISNFAIIDEVDLDLEGGLTVLTGETGAGKSILVDALGLALGDRADASAVRHGESRAEITVTVDPRGQPAVNDWLREQMLEADDECVIRRVIGAEGRSRAFINGQPVPLTSLKALGERLIDIHGQHAHQSLTRGETQRGLLDHHGDLGDLARDVREAFEAWQQAQAALDDATAAGQDHTARLELLRYQVNELQAFDIGADEFERLSQEHTRLNHSGRLLEGSQQVLQTLYEDEHSARDLLARGTRLLEQLRGLDDTLGPACELLHEAGIQVNEAADILRSYTDNLELDPNRAEEVAQRLHEARELARKHRVEPEMLHAVVGRLSAQLDTLDNAEARLDELSARARETEARCRALADELHAARLKAAVRFGDEVTTAMQTLGMSGGRFEVDVVRDPQARLRAHGLDAVTFTVTANPGQPAAPLARVASGGELSRISLAIQVVAADGNAIPCMVFDEVDTGVGGGVAEIVGRRLRQLGADRQVMCVTHLPQVASQGHRHLKVSKLTDGNSTRTTIARLDGNRRVEEIARMLGGVEITPRTRAHAQEMLLAAGEVRKKSNKKN